MKRLLYLILVLLLVAGVCSTASAQKYKFRIAYTDAPRLNIGSERLIHVTVAAVYGFEDAINSLTGGAVEVDFKHSGVLGGQVETLEQTQAGVIEATTPAIPALAGFYPNIQILSIPYLWKSPVVAWEVLDGEFGQAFFDDMAKKTGIRVITIFDNGGYRSFTNNTREVRSAKDMKGLKIRVMESPTEMRIVSSLGAAPTPIPWVELYTSLQTGVVDGEENSAATIIAGSLYEVQKYYTIDQHTLSLAVFAVSEKWFQSLPKDIQNSVMVAGKVASVCGRGAAYTNNTIAMQFLKDYGLQIYFPTAREKETFSSAAQPSVLDWMRKNRKIENEWIDRLLRAVDQAERKYGLK
jgi:tripartite ATP-independent transporter DctP family solute receptor